MQEVGDKTAAVGAGMTVVGAAVAGVGASPGLAVSGTGKVTSLIGAGLEVAVEAVAGSNKNAVATLANEVTYGAIGALGGKAVDQLLPAPLPGLSTEIKQATKQFMGFVESKVKSQTDKSVDKIKEQDQKK